MEDKFYIEDCYICKGGERYYDASPSLTYVTDEKHVIAALLACLNGEETLPTGVKQYGEHVNMRVLLGVYTPLLIAVGRWAEKKAEEAVNILNKANGDSKE